MTGSNAQNGRERFTELGTVKTLEQSETTTFVDDELMQVHAASLHIDPAENFFDPRTGSICIDGKASQLRATTDESNRDHGSTPTPAEYADGIYVRLRESMAATGKSPDFIESTMTALAEKRAYSEPGAPEKNAADKNTGQTRDTKNLAQPTVRPEEQDEATAESFDSEETLFPEVEARILRDFKETLADHADELGSEEAHKESQRTAEVERILEYYEARGGPQVNVEHLLGKVPTSQSEAKTTQITQNSTTHKDTTEKFNLPTIDGEKKQIRRIRPLRAKHAGAVCLAASAAMVFSFSAPSFLDRESRAEPVETDGIQNPAGTSDREVNSNDTPALNESPAPLGLSEAESDKIEHIQPETIKSDEAGSEELTRIPVEESRNEPTETVNETELSSTSELFPGMSFFDSTVTQYERCVDIARELHPSDLQLPRSFTLATIYSLIEYASNGNLFEEAPRAKTGTMTGLFGMNPAEVEQRFNELGYSMEDLPERIPELTEGEQNAIEATKQILVAYDHISTSVMLGLVDYYDELEEQGKLIYDEESDSYNLTVTQEEYEESLYKIYAVAITDFYGDTDSIAGTDDGGGLVTDIFRGIRRGDDSVINQLRGQQYNQIRIKYAHMIDLKCDAFVDDNGLINDSDAMQALRIRGE